MPDETPIGSAGAPDRPGHPGGNSGEQSPLQARAQFLKNRSWEFVVSHNRGTCERGRAQHGFNRETQEAAAREWEEKRNVVLTLIETLDLLKSFHRRSPFLFFNGNTFAAIGRDLSRVLFSDLPPVRSREVISSIAHYIAGVLDRDVMVKIVESLCETDELKSGDRVQTLKGSLRGVIHRMLPDGRVAWRPDGQEMELIALPESLLREQKK